jgi:predicted DNA-binding protein with PD1-like motif
MDYSVGNVGRVVVARGFEGENLYEQIEGLAAKEGIESAVCFAVGGLRSGKVVVGPKDPHGPLKPMFREFDDAREIVGVGTLFSDEDGPKLHFHAGIGRGEDAMVGCPRGGASVFCVLEIVLLEITGVSARRALDPDLAIKLLRIGR